MKCPGMLVILFIIAIILKRVQIYCQLAYIFNFHMQAFIYYGNTMFSGTAVTDVSHL